MGKNIISAFVVIVTVGMAFILGISIGTDSNSNPQNTGVSSDILNRHPFDLFAGAGHSHAKRNVTPGKPVPERAVEVLPDPMKQRQYTLHLMTGDFTFTPERVSGEDHAHPCIAGMLISRLYGAWHHISVLKPGSHPIYVTNYNDHDVYAVDGMATGAEVPVDVR